MHTHDNRFQPCLNSPAAFAPIVCIMPYESVDEAISIANGTRYGLGASVWGPRDHECIRVARALECGMVSVNDFGVFYVSFDVYPVALCDADTYYR